MNNKITKLKKTRKVKKNIQKGGYIISPTNPYFMAVAAVIGGLYAYGKTQTSNTELQQETQGQSGGRKFRKTRRRKGGMDSPVSKRAKKYHMPHSRPLREAKMMYLNTLTLEKDFSDSYFKGRVPPIASLYRSIGNLYTIEELNKFEDDGNRNIAEHYKKWRLAEASARKDIRNKNKVVTGDAKVSVSDTDDMNRIYAEIQREIDEEAELAFEKETYEMENIPETPKGIKYGDVGAVERPNIGWTPTKARSTGELFPSNDDLDLDLDLGLDIELFREEGKRKRKGGRTRKKGTRKRGTRRRKQKGGDTPINGMVFNLISSFERRHSSVSNFNMKHEFKMEVIKRIRNTTNLIDLQHTTQQIVALFMDLAAGSNLYLYVPELKDQLKEILRVICERGDIDCSNQDVQRILL